MLNRRGFFKAAAAVGTVTATSAPGEATPALVGAVLAEIPVQRIPDGPVVGIGFQPLLETLANPELAARVVAIYASDTDQSSVWMHFMQQEPDNWHAKMKEAQEKIAALKTSGKLLGYIDHNIDEPIEDSWPHPDNGEWQSFPFVSYAEEEELQGRPRRVRDPSAKIKRIRGI